MQKIKQSCNYEKMHTKQKPAWLGMKCKCLTALNLYEQIRLKMQMVQSPIKKAN